MSYREQDKFFHENLDHFEPTEYQYRKFEEINKLSDEEWEERCVMLYDDCSICPMAIHQYLITTDKHTCVYGITKEKFEALLDNADCSF